MNIQDSLMPFIVGGTVTYISHRIIRWWQGENQEILKYFQSLDDKLEMAIKGKFPSFAIPIPIHNTYDWVVLQVVTTLNSLAGNGEVIRRVLRAIARKDPATGAILLKELKTFWDEILKGSFDKLSPELKEIFNEAKKEIAVTTVANRIVTACPEMKKTIEEIEKDVEATVEASKINKPRIPLTREDYERLIKETQERQRKLGGQ